MKKPTISKQLNLLTTLEGEIPDALLAAMEAAGIVEQEIVFLVTNYSPGRPATMYLSNGDPGDPAEGPEWDEELAENYGCVVVSRIFSAAANNLDLRRELLRYRGKENVVDEILYSVNTATADMTIEQADLEDAA